MKLEDLFTAEELVLIDSGEYRPGRAALDAKLALWAAAEREACAQVCDALHYEVDAYGAQCAAAIRARGQA